MLQERLNGIIEELAELNSMEELKALWCFGQVEDNEYADVDCVSCIKAAVARLRNQPKKEVQMDVKLEAKVANPLAQVEAPKPGTAANSQVKPVIDRGQPVVRGSKRYRLLKTDVSWSTKPQVHAVMGILEAHVRVGDVLDESTIVSAMVANEHVLQTRQGGKRIWDYYKGDHAEGLIAHGNVEKV